VSFFSEIFFWAILASLVFFSYQVVNFCHKTEHWPFPTDKHEQSEHYKVSNYLNVTTWGNDFEVTLSCKYLGFRVYLYSQTESFTLLEHLQRCSVCDPAAKKNFTSKFSYVLFCNPTYKTETGTANRWGTTNSKPLGRIIMMGQSATLSRS
jgi:hypothetical protein